MAQVAAGLSPQQQRGTWYAVRVDRALDALAHVRALIAAEPGHKPHGDCQQCPAETLASFAPPMQCDEPTATRLNMVDSRSAQLGSWAAERLGGWHQEALAD